MKKIINKKFNSKTFFIKMGRIEILLGQKLNINNVNKCKVTY